MGDIPRKTTTAVLDRRFFNDQATVLSLALLMYSQNTDILNSRTAGCTEQRNTRLDYWQERIELQKHVKPEPKIRRRSLKRMHFATQSSDVSNATQ